MKVKPNVNETKITCPVCLSKNCFEETFEKDDNSFSSYMCFRCGFSSNSQYTHDSPDTENIRKSSTALINEVSFYDEEREILWFPTVLNMGNFGMIYPDGVPNNWNYKFAKVRKLSQLEKKDPKYNGYENVLDVENAKIYGQHDFLEACQDMGIITDEHIDSYTE
tara:strand:- start:123 stop:617 length:495 start_codon:yes stop_codon:yes gene_type:complete